MDCTNCGPQLTRAGNGTGNASDDFCLEARWPDGTWSAEDDIAQITLQLSDKILTRLADALSGETRDYVFAPPVALALWFTENWWRLRYEPFPAELVPPTQWRLRHELTSVSSGVRWPPFMLYGAGRRIVVAPRSGTFDIDGAVRYLNFPVLSIDAGNYEAGLDAFLSSVRDACKFDVDRTQLVALLETLTQERNDPEVVAWRRLEARLGFDPNASLESLMEQFAVFEDRLGETAIGEAAVSAPGEHSAEILGLALTAANESTIRIDRSVARSLPSAEARPTANASAWRLAEKAAAELRERIGIPSGPVSSTVFADLLRVDWELLRDAQPTAENLPYGAVAANGQIAEGFALRSARGSGRGRRFELARAIGDASWESRATFAPVSRAKTDRQKFQRAFAQSFLCPFDDLIDFIGPVVTEDKIANAANHFFVADRVVETVLVNKQVLPRERLEDRLELA